MKDFIIEHYKILSVVASILIEIILTIILIVKKPKKIDVSVVGLVRDKLPTLIRLAESKFGAGNGSKKFDFVLMKCIEIYKMATGTTLQPGSFIVDEFASAIEDILSTPEKK